MTLKRGKKPAEIDHEFPNRSGNYPALLVYKKFSEQTLADNDGLLGLESGDENDVPDEDDASGARDGSEQGGKLDDMTLTQKLLTATWRLQECG